MNKILILADDLTGANDTGAAISQLGWSTCSVVNDRIRPPRLEEFSCVSVNLDSRSLEAEAAYQKVMEAVGRFADPGIALYSKRIDSTLRGNLGAECDALLDYLSNKYKDQNVHKEWAAMIVPAFPQAGRTYEDDVLYVNGVPLAQTAAARDPKRPVKTSSALEIFRRQSGRETEVISLETVRGEKKQILSEVEKLWERGVRNILFEAVTQEDIEHIAQSLLECSFPFIAADPGSFTAALTAARFGAGTEGREFEKKEFAGDKILAVIGSVNDVAKAQAAKLLKRPDVGWVVMDVEKILENSCLCGEHMRQAAAELVKIKNQKKISALLFSSSVEKKHVSLDRFKERDHTTLEQLCEKINQSIAYIAAEAVNEGGFGGIFTTGGDITVAVCTALDAGGIRIEREILPLAVGGRIHLDNGKEICIATKGGMIGDEHAACSCIEYLLERLK